MPARREAVFAFLADLANHWALADRAIEVISLEHSGGPGSPADGGRVRLRGPFGVRRLTETRVLEAHPSGRMTGSARIGRRTRARVSWELRDRNGGTQVRLAATVERAGALDRLLLATGAQRWLEGRFAAILERLAERFDDQRPYRATSWPRASAPRTRPERTSSGEAPGDRARGRASA